MKKLLMVLVAAAMLMGCGATQNDGVATDGTADEAAMADEMSDEMVTEGMDEMAKMPEPTPDEVTVLNAMSNETIEGMPNGAAYLTVLNGLDEEITLASAEADSEVAEVLTMHDTEDNDGILRMVAQPEGFAVPAGGSLVLEPGGKHIMLENLSEPLAQGSEFELTLNFEGAESQTVSVPVVAMGETMDHSEMGHGEDHGDEDHGNEDHTGMEMTASAIVSDVEALDVGALHDLDEALADGAEIEESMTEMVTQFLADFNAIDWPASLATQVADANDSLAALEDALAADDAETAQSMAATAHEQVHALENALADNHGEEEHDHSN